MIFLKNWWALLEAAQFSVNMQRKIFDELHVWVRQKLSQKVSGCKKIQIFNIGCWDVEGLKWCGKQRSRRGKKQGVEQQRQLGSICYFNVMKQICQRFYKTSQHVGLKWCAGCLLYLAILGDWGPPGPDLVPSSLTRSHIRWVCVCVRWGKKLSPRRRRFLEKDSLALTLVRTRNKIRWCHY